MKQMILTLFATLCIVLASNAEGLMFIPKPHRTTLGEPAFVQKRALKKAPVAKTPAEIVSGSCGYSLTWSFDTETGALTITGSGAMYDFEDIYDNDGQWLAYSTPWFGFMDEITSVSLPYGLVTIGDNAFAECTALTSVNIPATVQKIGYAAFYACTSLNSITIPGKVKSIGDYAFCYDTALSSVTLSEGTTSIGKMAFRDCHDLSSIDIPSTVTKIGTGAFINCSSLTSITIPESVTTINQGGTFQSCASLTSVQWNAIDCAIEDSAWYPPFFDDEGHITSFTFGEQVTSIPTGLCDYVTGLTSVTIPNSVISIGDYAFAYSTGLNSVTLSNSVARIGENAFRNCSSLASVSIPNSVSIIGSGAFNGCESLTSVTIPESVTSIGIGATFQNCTSLSSVQWNAIDCAVEFDEEERYYPPFWDEEGHITNFTFGDQVTTIPTGLCQMITGVNSITIPNSVTTIGYHAFFNCSSLASITIPENVTTLRGGATFQGCTSLASVQWNAINCVMADNIDGDFYAPFWNLSNLTDFTLGDNVVTIPRSLCYGLPNLTSIIIPNSVTSIGAYAFRDCTSLTFIDIPSGVTTIGNYAFYNCSALHTIYNHATTPQYLESDDDFYNVDPSACTLIVPYQSVSLYRNDYIWSYFYNIKAEAMTVDQLLSVNEIQALTAGQTTTSSFTVRGYVTKIQTPWSSTARNMTFWIDDVECGDQNKFEIYRGTNTYNVAAKVGDYVECTGKVCYYNGQTYEMIQGSTYTIITSSSSAQEMGATTIANYISEADCKNPYTLTGTVSNITNTVYGNFDLTDETGTIFIYGLLTSDGLSKQFSTFDIEEGDEVTLKGVYSFINDTHEIANAIFVSRRKGSATSLDNANPPSAAQKLIRDGQILIMRGEKTYTLQGQEAK